MTNTAAVKEPAKMVAPPGRPEPPNVNCRFRHGWPGVVGLAVSTKQQGLTDVQARSGVSIARADLSAADEIAGAIVTYGSGQQQSKSHRTA